MSKTVEYFLSPQSPWCYLGHQRLVDIARETGAQVELKPFDLGKVFSVSGGLPLAKRAPQRQAYRLVELARWRDHLGVPLTVQPKFFPVAGDDAARLICAVDAADGTDAALRLAGAVLAACWAQERNIADAATLAELLAECGLPAGRLALAREPAAQQAYAAHTQAAIDHGVFGAPSWIVDGELFWGQDRLDFLARKLQALR